MVNVDTIPSFCRCSAAFANFAFPHICESAVSVIAYHAATHTYTVHSVLECGTFCQMADHAHALTYNLCPDRCRSKPCKHQARTQTQRQGDWK